MSWFSLCGMCIFQFGVDNWVKTLFFLHEWSAYCVVSHSHCKNFYFSIGVYICSFSKCLQMKFYPVHNSILSFFCSMRKINEICLYFVFFVISFYFKFSIWLTIYFEIGILTMIKYCIAQIFVWIKFVESTYLYVFFCVEIKTEGGELKLFREKCTQIKLSHSNY